MTPKNKEKKIRLLICDDSKLIVAVLTSIFEKTTDICVVGSASNGQEAIDMAEKLKPDIITMDIAMPKLNGYEATKHIMANQPTPIIIISSLMRDNELNTTFEALNAGALAVFEKPSNILSKGFEVKERHLINKVRALSGVKVIRRRTSIGEKKSFQNDSISTTTIKPNTLISKVKVVALGVSTGGPEAIKQILSELPANFPVPIVIVLHITKGFIQGLLTWLQKTSKLTLKLAEDNMPLMAGNVYFAPDDYHLTIKKGTRPIAILDEGPLIHHCKPSVTSLFDSLSTSYGTSTVAGILTGMGQDGSTGLLKLKDAGAYTFGQSESSCVIYGMPMRAMKLGAVKKEIDLSAIAEFLTILTK